MFSITQYLVIHIEVVFILHFFVFFLLLDPITIWPGLAKHLKVGRRFGVSVYATSG
jgi:hypothetical protein